ncbi:MAG TPA: hypothetical protein P5340_13720 [Defluviicoccus sp.]|nr:hypothetical protein [Defluviicoccus sp.]
MAETRTFTGITPDVWERLKAYGRDAHGTQFEPEDAPSGVATTRTPVGEIAIRYDYDEAASRLCYTLERKPFFVMGWQIWGGIEATLDRCRSCG